MSSTLWAIAIVSLMILELVSVGWLIALSVVWLLIDFYLYITQYDKSSKYMKKAYEEYSKLGY